MSRVIEVEGWQAIKYLKQAEEQVKADAEIVQRSNAGEYIQLIQRIIAKLCLANAKY